MAVTHSDQTAQFSVTSVREKYYTVLAHLHDTNTTLHGPLKPNKAKEIHATYD